MPRERFRPEEIIAKLREADVLLGQGKRLAEVAEVRARGVWTSPRRVEGWDRNVTRPRAS